MRYVISDLLNNFFVGSFKTARDAERKLYEMRLNGDNGLYNIIAIKY